MHVFQNAVLDTEGVCVCDGSSLKGQHEGGSMFGERSWVSGWDFETSKMTYCTRSRLSPSRDQPP